MSRRKSKSVTKILSIFGKLYDNKLRFGNWAESLNFITNARIDIKLKDNSKSTGKDHIHMSEVLEEELVSITKQLQDEHSIKDASDFPKITYLQVSNLSLNDHDDHTMGKLYSFLQKRNAGHYEIRLLHQSLFDEVKRKTNVKHSKDSDYKSYLKNKCICKEEFEEIIKTFYSTKDNNYQLKWQSIYQRLIMEAFGVQEVNILKMAYQELEIAKTSSNNILSQINNKLIDIHQKLSIEGKLNTNLRTCIDLFMQEYDLDPVKQNLYNYAFIKANILDILNS